MDLYQVVTQSVGARLVKVIEYARVAEPFQILRIRFALFILGQQTDFVDLAEGDQNAVRSKRPNIQRSHMAGEPVECPVRPKQSLSPVRHVFVSKRTRGRRVENSTPARFTGTLVVDPDWLSVAV